MILQYHLMMAVASSGAMPARLVQLEDKKETGDELDGKHKGQRVRLRTGLAGNMGWEGRKNVVLFDKATRSLPDSEYGQEDMPK